MHQAQSIHHMVTPYVDMSQVQFSRAANMDPVCGWRGSAKTSSTPRALAQGQMRYANAVGPLARLIPCFGGSGTCSALAIVASSDFPSHTHSPRHRNSHTAKASLPGRDGLRGCIGPSSRVANTLQPSQTCPSCRRFRPRSRKVLEDT